MTNAYLESWTKLRIQLILDENKIDNVKEFYYNLQYLKYRLNIIFKNPAKNSDRSYIIYTNGFENDFEAMDNNYKMISFDDADIKANFRSDCTGSESDFIGSGFEIRIKNGDQGDHHKIFKNWSKISISISIGTSDEYQIPGLSKSNISRGQT